MAPVPGYGDVSVRGAASAHLSAVQRGKGPGHHLPSKREGEKDASGTNHTLPTNGYAKAYSGVSLDSFIRKITFQEILPEGIKTIGPAIEEMAANEHLDAHKNAVTIRLKAINK